MDTAYIHFDDIQPGTLPPAWVACVTGKGSPHWAVKRDPTAPSAPNVLKQWGKRHVGPGAVGVWTKADSVTAFDDFRHGSAP